MKHILFVLMVALSFVARAASPAYSTSTGVVSPTQFLKLDAAELKVMGNPVSTNSGPTIYSSDGTLAGNRIVNGGGNSLAFSNAANFKITTPAASALQSQLFRVDNGNTNVFVIGREGGVYIGPNTLDDYGGFIGGVGFQAESFSDFGSGRTPLNYMQYGNLAYDWWASVSLELLGTTNSNARAYFYANSADTWGWGLYASLTSLQFVLFDADREQLNLEPTISATETPYTFNTSLTHTAGNLVEINHNNTNKFTIDYLGNITANNINIPGDQTANNLTITNELVIKGSAKMNTLIVTNNVNFYNNTYVSNIYSTATTVSNNITVLGNYVGTIDPTASGTVLKLQKSLKLQFPRKVDGAGCTYSNTNDYTSLLFMLPTFSGTAATNVNNCDFAFRVPGDLDTSKDLTASLTIRLTDVDTAAHTYNVGMVSIANSSSASGTPANYVTLTVAADGSGGSGDIESVENVTLTSWRSNMTAGQWCLLRLNREGGDASTVASNMMELEIFYWATQ